jgi:hypothetical protein
METRDEMMVIRMCPGSGFPYDLWGSRVEFPRPDPFLATGETCP